MRLTSIQDTPQYRKQKKRYESVYPGMRRRLDVPFDTLFELFSDRCVTETEIAKAYDTSKQVVSAIYCKYFREVFHATGRDRRRFCTMSARRKLVDQLRNTPPEKGHLLSVWKKAESFGYEVRRVPGKDVEHSIKPWMYKDRLEIEGKLCAIRNPKNVSVRGYAKSSYYGPFIRRPKDFSFLIIKGGSETFIIPTTMVNSKRIYIKTPAKRGVAKVPARVEWRDYKDRWDLLRGSQ